MSKLTQILAGSTTAKSAAVAVVASAFVVATTVAPPFAGDDQEIRADQPDQLAFVDDPTATTDGTGESSSFTTAASRITAEALGASSSTASAGSGSSAEGTSTTGGASGSTSSTAAGSTATTASESSSTGPSATDDPQPATPGAVPTTAVPPGTAAPTTAAPTTAFPTTAAPTTAAPTTVAPGPSPTPSPSPAVPVSGALLHVDGVTGTDGASGTVNNPFRSIARAMQAAAPGTTVLVRGGTYDDRSHIAIEVDVDGRPDAWIVVKPFPGETAEIVGGGEFNNAFRLERSSYVSIEGFRLTGRDDSLHGSGVRVDFDSHNIRVAGNVIQGWGGGGVSVTRSEGVLIEGNYIRDTSRRSFYQTSAISFFWARGPGNGTTPVNIVRNNVVTRVENLVPHPDWGLSDGNCVIIDFHTEGYTGWTLIENNLCVDNGGRGIHAFHLTGSMAGGGELSANNASEIYFFNNLVFNAANRSSWNLWQASNIHFSNNAVLNGTPPPGSSNWVLGSDIAGRAAGSIDPYNYRPSAGHEIVGSSDASSQPSHDMVGKIRPATATVGAMEP
jgi:hypothetical protein